MEGRTGASDESVSQIEETVKYFKEMLEGSQHKIKDFAGKLFVEPLFKKQNHDYLIRWNRKLLKIRT